MSCNIYDALILLVSAVRVSCMMHRSN